MFRRSFGSVVFGFALASTLGSTIASAQMSSSEKIAADRQKAAFESAVSAANEAKLAVDAAGTAANAFGGRIAATAGLAFTSFTTDGKELLRNLRAKAAAALAVDANAAALNTEASMQQQRQYVQEVNRAELRFEDARDAASGKVSDALKKASEAKMMVVTTKDSLTSATAATLKAQWEKTADMIWLDAHSLQTNYNGYLRRFSDIKDAAIVLERNLDNSIMAGYMKEKIARTLNSDSLCKAAASCTKPGGKNTAKLNSTDLGDIFPNMTKPSSNSAPQSGNNQGAK